MGDGYLGKCKDCTKADTAARVAGKAKDPDWVVAEAARQRAKQAKYRVDGVAVELRGEMKRDVSRRHAEKYPEKTVARTTLRNAIRDGRLTRKPCEVCGSLDSEGHHDDYSKPLDVIWLCPKHHAERHVQMRDELRRKRALERQIAAA